MTSYLQYNNVRAIRRDNSFQNKTITLILFLMTINTLILNYFYQQLITLHYITIFY